MTFWYTDSAFTSYLHHKNVLLHWVNPTSVLYRYSMYTVLCNQLCKKGSSTHIQFYELGRLYCNSGLKAQKCLKFLYLLTFVGTHCCLNLKIVFVINLKLWIAMVSNYWMWVEDLVLQIQSHIKHYCTFMTEFSYRFMSL